MDKVLFLIYGVTWVIGVSMPFVILWIYRTVLKLRLEQAYCDVFKDKDYYSFNATRNLILTIYKVN